METVIIVMETMREKMFVYQTENLKTVRSILVFAHSIVIPT